MVVTIKSITVCSSINMMSSQIQDGGQPLI